MYQTLMELVLAINAETLNPEEITFVLNAEISTFVVLKNATRREEEDLVWYEDGELLYETNSHIQLIQDLMDLTELNYEWL